MIYFSVCDNGKGIDERKLKAINDMLESGNIKDDQLGYGIFNVNERIKLMYGKEYGVTFKSIFGEGTMVEIKHPIIE